MRSKNVARASSAVLLGGVAVESEFASLAAESLGVVKALEAFAGRRVTTARKVRVDVVVTPARLTTSARYERASKIAIGATVTAQTCIPLFTVTNHVAPAIIKLTGVAVLETATVSTRT